MQWPGRHHDRGLKLCSRCWSWFASDGAHYRFCTPCRAARRAAVACIEPAHWEPHDEVRDDGAFVAVDGSN